jgi:hypothetical protein
MASMIMAPYSRSQPPVVASGFAASGTTQAV